MKIIPVVLSGGSGTRLWPLSRAVLPKQLLPLVTDQTMLQETLTRLSNWADVGDPLVVCGNDHRFLVAEQLRQVNLTPEAIVLEPVARNTAPAIAAAAIALKDKDILMLVLPADHVITDVAAFEAAVRHASVAAEQGRLVTFGIEPTQPETGYGYIQSGDALVTAEGCFNVARFVEKPDAVTAQQYLDAGNFYWNSGMFLFKPSVFLTELQRYAPEMVTAVSNAVAQSYKDLDFVRLHEASFAESPADSIDYAVMEKTTLAAVVPASMGWNDVGSWTALKEVQPNDAAGNAVRGDVYLKDVQNTLIRAESRFVSAVGVEDLLIVETSDAVLVAHRDCAQDVKNIVDHLKANGRSEHKMHPRVYRPWGWYEGIDIGERFQVKRIMVKPGERLSLQMHHHRAEHWVVVSGSAMITIDDVTKLYTENESTYIPIGSTHRLENPGKVPLHLIEVQSGSYLGEDDIVRFEDTYGRH
ncbi:mannose-1-phosphate guanylyltransferase/mannose-1-phosphate guanylyltransferase / mannose-6-phosphate isomerase [Methylophilus rhizosphaerae]|uniref:mannose-1-phosphate guanylyltransferase n=1 Tax=Methylophilus rhizosphaerae TaxID=492660 RepID=A0A1G8Z070_9PROT|nr:mannose-1-phosphate guanylyltransferase/mannose-6-phosphate isomerase [Methylophilus rhizosphaerae]SDK08436.1 mannose-1-phosphate guanylyltransferase/mannose-1-phosphate guanylyltransferase / mannose-6-phosphate isomerase [Methylophilus rhizosphaerae]